MKTIKFNTKIILEKLSNHKKLNDKKQHAIKQTKNKINLFDYLKKNIYT